MDYRIGDRVRIVDYSVPAMADEMLKDFGGKIMTISSVATYDWSELIFLELEEDRFGWAWTNEMIQGPGYNSLPDRTNYTLPCI